MVLKIIFFLGAKRSVWRQYCHGSSKSQSMGPGFAVEITGQTMDNRAAVGALALWPALFHVNDQFVVVVAQLVRAPDCGSGGWGFKSPQPPQQTNNVPTGSLAQSAEQGTLNPKVIGSIPIRPTTRSLLGCRQLWLSGYSLGSYSEVG